MAYGLGGLFLFSFFINTLLGTAPDDKQLLQSRKVGDGGKAMIQGTQAYNSSYVQAEWGATETKTAGKIRLFGE